MHKKANLYVVKYNETIQLEDANKTIEHGRIFAGNLSSSGATIALVGDLGAGKTTWVKGFAQGLGIDQPIKSPTYTYCFTYEFGNRQTMAHYDLYRVMDQQDVSGLGILEAVDEKSTITIIEWADRLPFQLPKGTHWLNFNLIKDDMREIHYIVI